jgi:RHS repeat-associated protein
MEGPWNMVSDPREWITMYNGKEQEEEMIGIGMLMGLAYYDPAIGRFSGVDPIADQFPWVSSFNYAENEPIANIDLWGLQKFYGADGSFIGKYGNSTEERIINSEKNIKLAQKVFSNGDPFQVKTFVERDFLSNAFSKPLYRVDDLNQLFDEFAINYRKASFEHVMAIYTKEFVDENGASFMGFQPGKMYTDRQRRNVFLGGSKFPGSGNWDIHSAIHNQPTSEYFSGYKSGNEYPQYGVGVTNDLGWSIHSGANILLVSQKII